MIEEDLRRREDKKSGSEGSGRGERRYRNAKIREIEGGRLREETRG